MRVVLELPDQPRVGAISYITEPGQRARVITDGEVAVLELNRSASRFLSRLFAQLAEGEFTSGFHLHFGEDLDSEANEMLRIVLKPG